MTETPGEALYEPAWQEFIASNAKIVGVERARRQARKTSFAAGFVSGYAEALRGPQAEPDPHRQAARALEQIEAVIAEQGTEGITDTEALVRIVRVLETARSRT